MTNGKSMKKALFTSSLSLLLCFTMLIGTTFAWFTDSVTTANNIITAGNLDVELYYLNDEVSDWTEVDKDTNVFKENTLWEPGHTEVVKLKVVNKGSLALKYQLGVNVASETGSKNVEGKDFKLSEYIKYGFVDGAQDYSNSAAAATAAEATASKLNVAYNSGNISLAAKDDTSDTDEKIVTMIVYMPTTVGNEANYGKGEAIPTINLGINLAATQFNSEEDSFGPDYDIDAKYPVIVKNVDELTKAVQAGGNIKLDDNIELTKTLMPTKDVVIDLNGKTIKTTASSSLFQSQSNYAPTMIITSSTAGAVIDASNSTFSTAVVHSYGKTEIRNVTINAGKNKAVQVQGNGSVEIYDTVINVASGNPFNVAGDFTLGKGTVVNVTNLNSSLISNSGAHEIVIDSAKINVVNFKVNGGAMISLTSGTTLALKNTEVKVGLDTTYTSYFISRAENATIKGCTFDIKDAVNNTYDIEFKPDSAVGAKYVWVQK